MRQTETTEYHDGTSSPLRLSNSQCTNEMKGMIARHQEEIDPSSPRQTSNITSGSATPHPDAEGLRRWDASKL